MSFATRLLVPLAALAALAAAPALAEPILLSYEATPSAGFGETKLDTATYDDKAAFSAEVLEAIVPKVAAAVGVDPAKLNSEVTPGGYLLKTNASLQTEVDLDDATADRLAAGLGYVFRQYSVLASRLDQEGGSTDYVVVTFPEGTLDAAVAQSFFEKAASVAEGLGGGYTAFGDEMIFLNVTDGDGNPYSGLNADAFLAGLTEAAAGFDGPKPAVTASGVADARFIGNDWDAAADGAEYKAVLGPETTAALDKVETDFAALFEAAAGRYGWR